MPVRNIERECGSERSDGASRPSSHVYACIGVGVHACEYVKEKINRVGNMRLYDIIKNYFMAGALVD